MSSSTPIGETAVISRPINLVASEIDGELVVLNIDTGQFFQLNVIGSRIWEALETPMTLPALTATIRQGFDVDAETCRRDVGEFVERLAGSNLLIVEPGA